MELLTGLEAGVPDAEGYLPAGSINALVAERLAYLAELRRIYAMKIETRASGNDEEQNGEGGDDG